MKNRKAKKILIYLAVFVSCIFVALSLYTAYTIYYFSNIEWKSDKNYYSFIVEADDIVDANVFRSPSEEYSKLTVIDPDTRERIAQYMEENNLKLKPGEQCFDRLDYTYNELIYNYFVFEPME